MSLVKFNDLITSIEAKHCDFFKGQSIRNYYSLNRASIVDQYTKKDELIIFGKTDLPNDIREEIADAFADAFFE